MTRLAAVAMLSLIAAVPAGWPSHAQAIDAWADEVADGESFEVPAGADEIPVDLVFALDNSGSMRVNDPRGLMGRTVQTFGETLGPRSRFGLVVFDGEARLVLPLSAATDGDFPERIARALEQVDYRGQHTHIPAGVERALYELRVHGRPQAYRVVVLVTDGIVDVGDPRRDRELSRWLRENLTAEARGAGVRIYGIAFTDHADFPLLQSLAQATKGTYFRILAASDIPAAFGAVQERLATLGTPPAADEAEPSATALPATGPTGAAPDASGQAVLDPGGRRTDVRGATRVEPPATAATSDAGWASRILAGTVLGGLGLLAFLVWRSVRRQKTAMILVPGATLRARHGRDPGGAHRLEKPLVRIGRARDNDIVLPYETVSAHHAAIQWRAGGFWLRDLDSTNGTCRNGVPVRGGRRARSGAARLRHGDVVSLDRYEFEFEHALAEEPGATRAGEDAADRTVVRRNDHRDELSVGRSVGALPRGVAREDARDAPPVPRDAVSKMRSVARADAPREGVRAWAPCEDAPDAGDATRAKPHGCPNHAAAPATELCSRCQRAWCPTCMVAPMRGAALCRQCAAKAGASVSRLGRGR